MKIHFMAKNPKNAFNKGLGTSGEINAILISALREAGFDAYPIAMSLRNLGRLPYQPTIDNFNYFIVAVDIENKPVYMDAASKYGDLNVLSPVCMSDFARSIRESRKSGWVDLTHITKSTGTTSINLQFNETGTLSGTCNEVSNGMLGYSFRKNYYGHKDQQDYIEKRETANNMAISDFKTKGLDNSYDKAYQSFNFTKNDVTLGNDHIYFNPIIFPIYAESPFKTEKRELPVEFSYPCERRISVNIKVPEGYAVEELPKPSKISLNDNDAIFTYLIQHDRDLNTINLTVRYSLNKIIYTPQEYELLRDFFSHVAIGNTNQLVLKKIN